MLDELPGRTARIAGNEYLFFSGYAYLGVQYVPAFKALVKEGIDKYGWLHPSSRISNTRLALYGEVEELLSLITGCESTVLVSSGYTAGKMAVEKWSGSITNLRPSHPAIQTNNPQTPAGIYAVDAVDVLASAMTDVNAINHYPALTALVIDDSHGIGLTGINGCGASSFLERKPGVEYVFTYSLSKALGINAGGISCSAELAAEYRSMPAYTASTASSPALLYAFLKGQDIYREQREKLFDNIQYFRQLISGIEGISNNPSLPVFVLENTIDENALLARQIIISSFPYPNPNGKRIQRVVVNALHTKGDLEKLAEGLEQCFGQ